MECNTITESEYEVMKVLWKNDKAMSLGGILSDLEVNRNYWGGNRSTFAYGTKNQR